MYLYLGKKVDPDPFGLQTARFLDPHTKVLHVCVDDILHCRAKCGAKRHLFLSIKKAYVFKVCAVYKGKKVAALNNPNTQGKMRNT